MVVGGGLGAALFRKSLVPETAVATVELTDSAQTSRGRLLPFAVQQALSSSTWTPWRS